MNKYKFLDWINFNEINNNFENYLLYNLDDIYKDMSKNQNSIAILEQNLDTVCLSLRSLNINAIYLLEKNIDKVNWYNLLYNVNSINILEKIWIK